MDSRDEENYNYFDNINLLCADHRIPYIGVCSDYCCKSKKLYCMKCINSPGFECMYESGNNHEILSLGQLFQNFFEKQTSNKQLDLIEFNSLMELIKDLDKKAVILNMKAYTEQLKNNLNSFITMVHQSLEKEIEIINEAFIKELDLIEEKFVTPLRKIELAQHEIPSSLTSNYSVKSILSNQEEDFETKINIINTLKVYNDKEYVKTEIDNIDSIIYISKLKEVDNLENLFQKKAEVVISKVEENLKELISIIMPSKKDLNFLTKDTVTKFESNPNDLVFYMNICENAHKSNSIDCVFTTFKSLKNEYLVVWGTPSFTISAYDLVTNKLIFNKEAHTATIFTCSHYADKKTKIDMIISSSYDKSIKVWNYTENMKPILHIPTAHSGFYIYSAAILMSKSDNTNYIITAAPNECSKLWSFTGKLLSDFGVSTESTYFLSTWYNPKLKKDYIINANSSDVKVYLFRELTLFKSYKSTPGTWHMSAHVVELNDIYCLVETDGTGNVRVWDFYGGIIISSISTTGLNLRGLTVWNDQYVISSGSDYAVKIYDIKNLKLSKSLAQHTSTVCAVNKINIPKLGECLISHALDGKLKLWCNAKYLPKK